MRTKEEVRSHSLIGNLENDAKPFDTCEPQVACEVFIFMGTEGVIRSRMGNESRKVLCEAVRYMRITNLLRSHNLIEIQMVRAKPYS